MFRLFIRGKLARTTGILSTDRREACDAGKRAALRPRSSRPPSANWPHGLGLPIHITRPASSANSRRRLEHSPVWRSHLAFWPATCQFQAAQEECPSQSARRRRVALLGPCCLDLKTNPVTFDSPVIWAWLGGLRLRVPDRNPAICRSSIFSHAERVDRAAQNQIAASYCPRSRLVEFKLGLNSRAISILFQ